MKQLYDWNLTLNSGESFKFFHTEKQMNVDEMWRIVRATEVKEHPDAVILHLTGEQPPFDTIAFRDKQYHVVPLIRIQSLWYVERTPAAERINFYDSIKGECGET